MIVAKAYNSVVDFPREWTAFGGASLALMGAAIGAGARRHAEDNLAFDALASPSAQPLDERAAGAAGWLLIVLWMWFGLRLLMEARR